MGHQSTKASEPQEKGNNKGSPTMYPAYFPERIWGTQEELRHLTLRRQKRFSGKVKAARVHKAEPSGRQRCAERSSRDQESLADQCILLRKLPETEREKKTPTRVRENHR